MKQTMPDKLVNITGMANDRPLPETLPTQEVFDRLVAVFEEATSALIAWTGDAGSLTNEQRAYREGVTDGIGSLNMAVEAIQDLALGRPDLRGRLGFGFPDENSQSSKG
jgi:hypothetical protein